MTARASETGEKGRQVMLEVRDATLHYGEVQALDRVTVVASKGEFLTILGESGSGKTSLLKIISGLETPTSANALRIGGKDVGRLGPAQRDCTTVFQHYALFPHMTVRENVEYGLKVRGIGSDGRRKSALEALGMVRLAAKADRRIHQLSGGERQRVALARAFVTRPSILLLDEPLGALDEKLRLDMQEELITLQRDLGITFIYITHSQEEALTMSDRIILMRRGTIAQEGVPTDLFDRPNSEFTARFMGVENILKGEIVGVDGDVVSLRCGSTVLRGQWSGAGAPRLGSTAVLGVRAEKIRFGLDPSLANSLNCSESASIYKGKYLDLTVETPVGAMRGRVWDKEHAPHAIAGISWSETACTVMEP